MSRSRYLGAFSATGLQVALSLATGVILARFLGPEGRGVVTTIAIWPAILLSVLGFSINEATVYHLSNQNNGHLGDRRAVSSNALYIQLLLSLILTIPIAFLMPHLLGDSRHQYHAAAIIYACAFCPITLMALHQKAVLQGTGQFGKLNIVRVLQPILYLASLVVLWMAHDVGPTLVMFAMIISTGLSVAYGTTAMGRSLGKVDGTVVRKIFHTGSRFQSINVLIYASAEIDKVLIVYLMTDVDVGIYMVALSVASVGYQIVTQSLAVYMFPSVASSDGNRRIVLVCQFFQTAVILLPLIACGVAIIAPYFVPLIFGSEFYDSVPAILVLLLALTFKGLRYCLDQSCRATRSTFPSIASELLSLSVLVLLAPWAIEHGGLLGLTWVVVAAQFAALVFMVRAASRKFGAPVLQLLGIRDPRYGSILSSAAQAIRVAYRQSRGR